MTPRHARVLALAAAVAALAPAAAESYASDRYEVHYNALPTMALTPAVAAQYGIARHASRALLNVTVLRRVPGKQLGQPMPAQVIVTAIGGQGSLKPLAMRRIDQPPQLHYLGELTVADRETVTFELLVTPEGADAPIRLRLQQQFFVQ